MSRPDAASSARIPRAPGAYFGPEARLKQRPYPNTSVPEQDGCRETSIPIRRDPQTIHVSRRTPILHWDAQSRESLRTSCQARSAREKADNLSNRSLRYWSRLRGKSRVGIAWIPFRASCAQANFDAPINQPANSRRFILCSSHIVVCYPTSRDGSTLSIVKPGCQESGRNNLSTASVPKLDSCASQGFRPPRRPPDCRWRQVTRPVSQRHEHCAKHGAPTSAEPGYVVTSSARTPASLRWG